MNLRDLDYLIAVAETGQISLAAERCHVSQPTLSMQLRKLEEELDVVLFERTRRGTVATARGQSVIAQARIVRGELARLRDVARGSEHAFSGTLRLGVIPTIGPYFLPLVLPALRLRYPGLRVLLREATTARLLEQLHGVELDSCVLSSPFDQQGLQSVALGREAVLMALPRDHRLCDRDALDPADLAEETVILLEEGHCFREQALRLSARLGLRPSYEVEASSIENLRQMVSVGLGLGLLPAMASGGPFARSGEVVMKPLRHECAVRELILAWRTSYPHGGQLLALAEFFKATLEADDPLCA